MSVKDDMKPLRIFSWRRRRRRRRVSSNEPPEKADVPAGSSSSSSFHSDRMVVILLMMGLVTLGGGAVGTVMASGEFIDSGHLVWTPIGQSLTRSKHIFKTNLSFQAVNIYNSPTHLF